MSEIRMLLIDQNGIITALDRNGYKKMGVSIKSATNYTGMQKILETEQIDVIVINYDYAAFDAAAACNHLKNSPATKDTPIVITSVQSIGRNLKKMIKGGFDLFVEQPIPRQYLIEKVRALLDQKTRKTNRVVLKDIPVALLLPGNKTVNCAIEDISQTGLLVNTEENMELEVEIDLVFSLPGYKRPFKTRGKIVRRIARKSHEGEDQLGYGILFLGFEGDTQERLERYIEKSHSDDPKLVYYL